MHGQLFIIAIFSSITVGLLALGLSRLFWAGGIFLLESQSAAFATKPRGRFARLVRYFLRLRPGAGQRDYQRWRDSLEDGLWSMARVLQAGHNVYQALEIVRGENSGPFGQFLSDVLIRHRSGVPLTDALRQAAEVSQWAEAFYVAEVLELGLKSGGHLLDNISSLQEMIRDRAFLKAQLAAGTGEARISAWILGLTPLALIAFMAIFQPGMILPLIKDPTGRLGAIYAVVSWASGVLIIRKLLQLPEGEDGAR